MKLFISIIFLISLETIAQPVPFPIAPLTQINNTWIYEDNSLGSRTTTIISIVDNVKYIDTLLYYEIEIDGMIHLEYRLREDGFYVLRRDTSFPEPNHEQIYYKQNAEVGDQWKTKFNSTNSNIYFTVFDTARTIMFGDTITAKFLNIRNDGLLDRNQVWSEEFGMLREDYEEGFRILKGCVIDNKVYGDTSITSIGIDNELVLSFRLLQNYPNPFNPTTTIGFFVKQRANVRISVTNILGETVADLVNEEKDTGNYSVQWNGTNYSSGIYFCSFYADNKLISARKLVLSK